MEGQETSAAEIKRLQRCMNDLVSVLALPAIWVGGNASRVARTSLDALRSMLALDVAYVRFGGSEVSRAQEMFEVAPDLKANVESIGALLAQQLGDDPRSWPRLANISINQRSVAIATVQLGVDGALGVIVAGSRRAGFPEQTEELFLRVAANQASIGLRESELLDVQKQIASELDRKVEQRTHDLASANAELKLQLGLLQTIPVAAWTLRPDGRPDFVNRNWLDYTGQTFDFVCSAPEAWMTAVHPEDREAAVTAFWTGIRSGQGFAMETRVLRAKDATYRWHLNRAVALRDPEGTVVKFVGTTTDIHDLKRSEKNLRSAEEKNRLILDSALDAVVTADTDGLITGWNKQAEITFGWSRNEAIGQQISKLIIPERDRTAHARGLRHFLATGEGPILGRRIEVAALRRGGVEFPVELEVVPVRVDGGWIFSAFIRDITESKAAQEELRNTQAELAHVSRAMTVGALTASIAHEVNQPLAGIITNASTCLRMLAADPPNIEGARETARRTIRDGYRASDVVTRLRALYGKKASTTEMLNLSDAAREVVALLKTDLERNDVKLRLELDDGLPQIPGDRVQLQQVILNLIRNASDSMIGIDDRPRQLVLRTAQLDESQVCLSVQDAGVGIEPDGTENLFKPFYTTKADGMGIGLSVSRFIIQNHHGRLWAARNVGPGSTFSFSIPCNGNSVKSETAPSPTELGISQNLGGGRTDRVMRNT